MFGVWRKCVYTSLVLLFASAAVAQVATGIYPYGTFDNLGIDSVNVGNLNVHVAFQLLNKAGRGMPFTYSMSYDSSVWTPVVSNGVTAWQPVTNWGWRGSTEAATGYASESILITACSYTSLPGPRIPNGYRTLRYNVVYHDAWGVAHPFAGNYWFQDSDCGSPTSGGTIGPLATDGSGYTYSSPGGGVILARNGTVLATPATFVPVGSATVTDTNGNQISVNSSGQFTDTTGNVALSVAGSAPPSAETFTYTDSTGTSRTVSLNYTTYTVQTGFGCSGIGEYGPTSTPLVSSMTFPDGTQYQFNYEQTPNVPGNVTGRLASIVLPQGGTIEYTYTGGNNGIECADGSAAGLKRTLATNAGSSASTWTYARSIPGTGTSSTAVTDGLNNSKTYTFVEASNQPSGTTAAYYETGRTVNQGASTTILARNTCYNGEPNPCPTTIFTLPISQIDTYETLNGLETHGATTKYTSYGVVSETELYDYASGSSRGPLLRREDWTYGYSIPNLPTVDAVSDGSSNLAGETKYGYDQTTPTASSGVPQHVAESGPRGNLTSETIYASSGTSYALSDTYEDTGSLLTSVTPNGTTTLSYDPTFVYNTGTAMPTPSSGVAIGTSASYDSTNTGQPLTSTDPNSQISKIPTYDSMLRPTEVDYPDGGKTILDWIYSPSQPVITTYLSSGNTSVYTYEYDGYNRLSRTALQSGQAANPWYQTDTCYDGNGNVSFTSYAYLGTGFGQSKLCSGAGDTYTYDVLGRVKTIVRANGETLTYNYSGRATQFIDENSVQRISQVDGLGRKTIVCEISSNSTMPGSGSPGNCGTDIAGIGFTTTYAYALATGTTTVTQGSQTRVFQTDWLGRTTSVQEPESGTTTYGYAYNSAGLVVTRKRPKANQTSPTTLTTTTTQYDSLSRPTSITYTDGTPTKTFAYDAIPSGSQSAWTDLTSANQKGRLALASVSGAGTAFSYDQVGRTKYLDECLPSGCGTVAYNRQQQYSYDLAGNLISSSDGGGTTSTYTVSLAGELQSLTSSLSNSTNPADVVSNVQNGPFGPISYYLGNGRSQYNSYDSLGRLNGGWVCDGTPSNSCSPQLYGFTAGKKGSQVQSSSDDVTGFGFIYGYDEFNRLQSMSNSTGQLYKYVYDRYGNRWSQNPQQGGRSSVLSFNASTNQINTSGYSYDAAGNMTNDGFHSYTYDAEGNMTQVDSGSTAQYVYNALNQRVRTVVSGTTTEFVFNANGQRVSVWNGSTKAQLRGQYYWGAKPVAFYANGSAHFQHQDWLGTERIQTTYNGNYDSTDFPSLPFGDDQTIGTGANSDPYYYATLDYDSETTTDHAQFRQYSSAQGRWMQPDPYNGSYDFSNPQSMNRYAYVLNNPLSYLDLYGLICSSDTVLDADGNVIDTGGSVDGCSEPCTSSDPAACGETPDPTSEYCLFNPGACQNQQNSGGGSGGGGGTAPNNPQNNNCGQILKNAALTVGLDAAGTVLGAIPGAGAGLVTAQVVVGLAGAANSAVNGDLGGTLAGTIGGAQLSAVAAGAEQVGWTSLKTFGGTAARALPWIGSAVSAYYFYKDATEALDKYQACKAGIGG